MKAVQFDNYGGPEVLKVADAGDVHADKGKIRIAVRAVGINGIDWKIRMGYMKDQMPLKFPAGTGRDASGIVDEVGAGVTDVVVGDEVFGIGNNTLAERAVLTSWTKKPSAMSFEEAAAYPVAVETALRILNEIGVQSGQTLVVNGASGGVGSAVVQFAIDRGVKVIAIAGARNHDYLRALGASPTTYGDGIVARVRALAPDGVDAALDIAGSGVIAELIELTGNPQKVLSIADFSAPQKGARVSTQPSRDPGKGFAEAARLFGEGKFTIPVEKTFSMEQAGEAHAAMQAGHAQGKYVVVV